jgi:putative hemolysin
MAKFIDVQKLIASKNQKAAKLVPRIVINWLKRIIHEEEVNAFFEKHEKADTHTFVKAIVDRFNLKLSIQNEERIPPFPDRIIFVANHPLGGLDAMAMIHLLKDIRPDVKFIVNDFLLAVTNLKDQFIGVNKVGKSAKDSLQKVERQFAEGETTFIFPAGLVSRKSDNQIEDLEWKKTFITKAKKYQLTIIPVHISGQLTNRFYRLANLRKFLGLKFNIEMLYLVDEMFYQENMGIEMTIGTPIHPEKFTKDKDDYVWAQWVKQQVYQLHQ